MVERGRGHQWAPPESHFAAFMTALARRYDGRTLDRSGRRHGPVEMFEPWNEPNLPASIGELDAIRSGLPVPITEFGWTTQPTSVRSSSVSEAEQERLLREALDMLAAIPRVRLAVWFNLQDNAEWTSGLRRADSMLKPSWPTFVALPKFRPPA